LPKKELIDFKEALIFAFLGLLRFDNQVNCLSSVTGAKYDHSSGMIFLPSGG
jgi:anhydro-N-acetylmuramic acid kinase